MADVRFEGRVFPTGATLSTREHPIVEIRDADRMDVRMRFALSIENGRIIVDCDVDNYSRDEHLMRLFVRAVDLANAVVNLAAFAMGIGASVVIDTAHEANGSSVGLILRDRELQALCTAFSPDDESFDKMIEIVHSDLRISRAIRDLTEAVSGPHLIPSLCARSMETLRVLIGPAGIERKESWRLMQQNLSLESSYLKAITDYGAAPRHGDHQFVPTSAIRMIAHRSWTIMNRFLEYKKRGSQPLSAAEFPMLTG